MLKIDNLSKSFKKRQVLKNISCTLDDGVYGLLGPNGAGKTTLMRHITQTYSSKPGVITYNNTPIQKNKEYMLNVGYLPQKFGLFKSLTVREALHLLANLKHMDMKNIDNEIDRVLETVNLENRVNDKIGTLSGGMIRRVGIAQALMGDPHIIVFDEPTAGLDPEERLRFKNIISEVKKNKIIIISTHIVEDVEATCDHLIVMDNGHFLFNGACDDIVAAASNKVYNVPCDCANKISGSYHIQKKYQDGNVDMMKILSGTVQNFPHQKPTIEDGYICLLKNI